MVEIQSFPSNQASNLGNRSKTIQGGSRRLTHELRKPSLERVYLILPVSTCHIYMVPKSNYQTAAIAIKTTIFLSLRDNTCARLSHAEATAAIGRYIDGFYNHVRHHSAFNFISPFQFERLAA